MPNNISIHPVSFARNLGIIFNSELFLSACLFFKVSFLPY